MKAFIQTGVLLTAVVAASGIAWAQFAKTEEAITYRKSVMQVIKKHFGGMASVVKGETPFDKKAFAEDAKVVAMMSKLPWEASLVPGSAEGDTSLKANALKDGEGFMAAAKRFEEASQNLVAAAESGEMGAVEKQFGATAQTCSGCHKAYKK